MTDGLRLIPVCPKSCGMHTCQAPLLARLRPGQWIKWGCGPTNTETERWVIHNAKTSRNVIAALRMCESITKQSTSSDNPAFANADFVNHKATDAFFSCFFFTTYRQWLDVVEIQLEERVDADTPMIASARSFSASIIPASSPLAFLPAMLLACCPFGDMGQNTLHLRTLRQLLADEGMHVEVVSVKTL